MTIDGAMIEHWFAPAAEAYMEDLAARNSATSAALIAALSKFYDFMVNEHPHPAARAARHAIKRIRGGA